MTSILCQQKRVFNATNSNDIISKLKKFFDIFLAFVISAYNLEYFEKKEILIDDFFVKLETGKSGVT